MKNPVQPVNEAHSPTIGIDLDERGEPNRPRILIIDDDADLIALLKITLRKAGYDVASATDSTGALSQAVEVNPHMILLDLMMPDVDGWSIYQQLRTVTSAPVIVITASGNQDYAVKSLEMGAQDYITKPFYNPELVARINKVLRQMKASEIEAVKFFPHIDLRIDYETHEILLRGRSIYLTPHEFNVLKVLADNAPKSLGFAAICKLVWGEDSPKHRSQIKNLVFLLRRKMEVVPTSPRLIVNYRSLGYQLDTRAGDNSRVKPPL